MTTSTTPPPTAIRICRPGDLIASVPGLLGFSPSRSLVVLCMEGHPASRVGLVMRLDLPDPLRVDPDGEAALVEQISALCSRRAAPAIIVIVVEDRAAGATPPHRELLAALRDACEEVGTELLDAHVVDRVVAGACWRGYDEHDHRGGTLPDPQSSMVSAAHVAQGRVIHGAREELDELLRRDPEPYLSRRADLIGPALDAALLARDTSGQRAVRHDLETVLAAVAQLNADEVLLDEEIARIGVALSDPLVRDACFGLAVGEHVHAAERLWLQLCRALPDPERAEAAVLVAYSCYVRGEGPLAGIALRAALTSMPGHRTARLLDSALSGGLPPEVLRDLADTALGIAAELGVALVPSTPRPFAAE
ncbi:MAG: DUF4192 domain-containing protein [Mycobacteriaceae bacterium]